MQPHQLFVADLTAALLGIVLAGLLVHRRARLCRSFLVYCVALLVGNRLVVAWPATFFTRGFWSLKATVYGLLCIGVAIEIALLTFSRFPRARVRMLTAVACVLSLGLLGLLLPHNAAVGGAYWAWVTVFIPRAEIVALFVHVAVLMLAFYHRIPLHGFHRGLMVGFALYLGVDPAVLALVRQFGPDAYVYLAAADPALFASTVGVWAWTAWRQDAHVSSIQRLLQPWAVRPC